MIVDSNRARHPALGLTKAAVLTPTRNDARKRRGVPWIILFSLTQIICQLALLLDLGSSIRMFARVAAFSTSLLLLVLLPKTNKLRHPAYYAALIALLIVIISIFNPATDSFLAGIAHATLYVAIIAPLFWVPRLPFDLKAFRLLLFLLLCFHALSATVGVLQVYFPGRLQPKLTATLAAQGEEYTESLKIDTATGERVFRPMGLTDTPGGAAISGFYAVLFGMAFMLLQKRLLRVILCLGVMTVGMMCLYLAQIRSLIVMALVCLLSYYVILIWRRKIKLVPIFLIGLLVVLIGGFIMASTIGGADLSERITTLWEGSPTEVYYKNRGYFLEATIYDLLPRYPLGAGLGHWGMINAYFGDHSRTDANPIWVEIQWTGWLLDGGVPLILAYLAAIIIATLTAWRITIARLYAAHAGEFWLWGGLIVAYNLGALAMTFNYAWFIGQGGMEFWLFNAAFYTAFRNQQRVASVARIARA
jgi:hypothetical protein